ncbi:MAG TPA: hypothetical protein PLH03_01990 [Methylophilaceae bacterium]|nr:hypothetical protein [Methylophilaceae bacterium]
MNQTQVKALTAAAAIAALFAGGMAAAADAPAKEAKVHCGGITSCKGTSDCKTATNACKGQNSCKGQGFKAVSAEECKAKGGKEL